MQFLTNVQQQVSFYHYDYLIHCISNLTILSKAKYRSSLSFPIVAKGGRAMVKLLLNTSLTYKKIAHSSIKAKWTSCKYLKGPKSLSHAGEPVRDKKALLRWMREGRGVFSIDGQHCCDHILPYQVGHNVWMRWYTLTVKSSPHALICQRVVADTGKMKNTIFDLCSFVLSLSAISSCLVVYWQHPHPVLHCLVLIKAS